MNDWFAYDEGRSIGRISAEGGEILHDDGHPLGARITLKRTGKYVSISCNIYGWIDHTRFFGTILDARREYVLMKRAIDQLIEIISSGGENDLNGWEAISEFVRRFP